MTDSFKSGYVTIVGRPNVGKSTLLNKLIGSKLSITSTKPQTTRLAIKGFYNTQKTQIIFIDTPGFLKPRYEMQKKMLNQINSALKDSDVLLFVTEANTFPTDFDKDLLNAIIKINHPKIALLNKSDLVKSEQLCDNAHDLLKNFNEVLYVSAISGQNVDLIIPMIEKFLPISSAFYEQDILSDLPIRFFAQEIIREGIFIQYEQEIPYSSAVIIDKYIEEQIKVIIYATIWVERDSQKIILIGMKGLGLKQIREYAEKNISELIQTKAEVHLWVKVKKNWRQNPNDLKQIGLKD